MHPFPQIVGNRCVAAAQISSSNDDKFVLQRVVLSQMLDPHDLQEAACLNATLCLVLPGKAEYHVLRHTSN